MGKKFSRRNCPIQLAPGQNCYSNYDRSLFRQRVMEELETAQSSYKVLKSSITHSDGNGAEDTSPTFKLLDEGAITLSKEEMGILAQRQEKRISSLKEALVRIENKTYGVLPDGVLISPDRLWAIPETTTICNGK